MIEYPNIPRRVRARPENRQFALDVSDAGTPRIADLGAAVLARLEIEHPLLSPSELAELQGWWAQNKGEVALLRSTKIDPGGFDYQIPIVGEPSEREVNARRTNATVSVAATRIPRFHFDARFGLGPYVNFSRSSKAWYWNAQGQLVEADEDEPRFEYDPSTGEFLGLLCEPTRTRLNEAWDEPTSPEDVTVTDVVHTLSFYGTGEVVLSGAHSATLTGTGASPERVELTFTPSAGTLTLTPSGDVQRLQLEVGAFASSPILGASDAQVTRSADVASVDLTHPFYTNQQGTWVWGGLPLFDPSTANSTNNRVLKYPFGGNVGSFDYAMLTTAINRMSVVNTTSSNQASMSNTPEPFNGVKSLAAYSWTVAGNRYSGGVNGTIGRRDDLITGPPTATEMHFGQNAAAREGASHTLQFYYLPFALSEAELAAVTAGG